MPKVKPYGNRDMKAIADAKDAAGTTPEREAELVRRLNALKDLTGKRSDMTFAALIGMSYGRYRYLKRHPSQFKLSEIWLVQALAKQYSFDIDFEIEANA